MPAPNLKERTDLQVSKLVFSCYYLTLNICYFYTFGDNTRPTEREKFYSACDQTEKMHMLYEKLDRIEANHEKYALIITQNQFNMHDANKICFNRMHEYSIFSPDTIDYTFEKCRRVEVIA